MNLKHYVVGVCLRGSLESDLARRSKIANGNLLNFSSVVMVDGVSLGSAGKTLMSARQSGIALISSECNPCS